MSKYRVFYTQTIGENTFGEYHYKINDCKDYQARSKKHAFALFQNEMLKYGAVNFKTFEVTDIICIIDAFSSYYDYFSDNAWSFNYTTANSIAADISSTAVETTMDTAPANTIYYQTYAYATADSWAHA